MQLTREAMRRRDERPAHVSATFVVQTAATASPAEVRTRAPGACLDHSPLPSARATAEDRRTDRKAAVPSLGGDPHARAIGTPYWLRHRRRPPPSTESLVLHWISTTPTADAPASNDALSVLRNSPGRRRAPLVRSACCASRDTNSAACEQRRALPRALRRGLAHDRSHRRSPPSPPFPSDCSADAPRPRIALTSAETQRQATARVRQPYHRSTQATRPRQCRAGLLASGGSTGAPTLQGSRVMFAVMSSASTQAVWSNGRRDSAWQSRQTG